VVLAPSGDYVLTYTAYDGKRARLMIATSRDLFRWTKRGPALDDADVWSKSGAIVTELRGDGEFVAAKLGGEYWMYWGDTSIFVAHSQDLIRWEVLRDGDGRAVEVLQPRAGYFDSDLVESGPQAVVRPQGVVLIYNSRNAGYERGGIRELPEGAYSAGQALLDPGSPWLVRARTDRFFLKPESPSETQGQVDNVVFVEGMVAFKGRLLLYLGGADTVVSVAVAKWKRGSDGVAQAVAA